jgi:hypothetical protein
MPSLTKKRTAAKKQQQQQQQQQQQLPSASTPTSPTVAAISDPSPSVTTTISAVDFRTFIQHAKLEDIDKFLELASATQDGRNLALFWERAYDRGYTEGRGDVLREELDMATEQLENAWMRRGRDVGYEEGYKKGKEDCLRDLDVDAARTAAFEEGRILGAANEKWAWETVGHDLNNLNCARPKSPLTFEVGVQSEIPRTTTVSSSTQTSPASLVNVDTQTSFTAEPLTLVSPRFDWADDVTSLPILPLLPTPSIPHNSSPRDFSCLRSTNRNPFSSIQRRSKKFHRGAPHSAHSNMSFTRPSHLSHRPPYAPSKSASPPHVSNLDWDQDSRLFDLSRALKALGWIRPRRGRRF